MTIAASRALFVGRATLDLLYRIDRLPEEDTKIYARQMRAAPGGPALNAALTCALLGGEAMLVSAVGGGPWAPVVRAELDRLGVKLLDLAAETAYEVPLCTVLVSTTNSSRTIVNPPISTEVLPALSNRWELPWGMVPTVVLSDGFFLVETLPLLAACRRAGATLCLDGGSWKPGTEELAPLLTVAICSERFSVPRQDHEAAFRSNAEGVFAWFAAKGLPYIAVTRGSHSILGWDRGRRFEIEIEPVEAKDTLGAGDVLHGAFCYFFALEQDFEAALRKASEIATLSCTSMGIQAWADGLGRTE